MYRIDTQRETAPLRTIFGDIKLNIYPVWTYDDWTNTNRAIYPHFAETFLPPFRRLKMIGLEKTLDSLLENRLGKKLLAKSRQEAATDTKKRREALVAEIHEIEAKRDLALNDLAPKVAEAAKRADAAMVEVGAATSSANALRRKRSSVCGSADRNVGRIELKLRRLADPAIDDFITETRRVEEQLYSTQIKTEEKLTERFSRWGVMAKVFSTKPSIEERLQNVREARQRAENLKLSAGDVSKELAELRAGLSFGDLKLQETKMEVEIPIL